MPEQDAISPEDEHPIVPGTERVAEPETNPSEIPAKDPTPMLDVHPAPHAATTWRDFFVHIATIVIGLFIAVSIEQTIEFLHHRHQRYQLQEELRRDSEANRQYIKDDITSAESIMDWALGQAAKVEHAGPTGPLTIRRMPSASIYRPDAGVWLAAKANGQSSLLPTGEQNWFDDLDLVQNELFVSNTSSNAQLFAAYGALDQALVGHVTDTASGELDLSTLNPAQRAVIADRLRTIATQTRIVLQSLMSYLDDVEYILSTPGDQLDTPQGMKRFMIIARENAKANPTLKYSFSAK